MLKPIIAIAALGMAGYAGYVLNTGASPVKAFNLSANAAPNMIDEKRPRAGSAWLVAAPGRVEPKSGEIQIASGMLGRISDLYISVNDHVNAGEVMIRLDDREARAGLAAAEAEAAARQKQRNAEGRNTDRNGINDAEDAVYAAERALTGARFGLDEVLLARRKGSGSDREVEEAENRLERATRLLQRERVALATAQANGRPPLPTLAESALSRARAEVATADAVLAKTRLRASVNGTVLRISAKVGEMVAPGPQQTLVVIGDMSTLRVKAEVDEADVAKVEPGQKIWVRSPSHPDKVFSGKVSVIAPSLGAPQIGPRGPRRPNDVEVLEVTIDVDKNAPLIPGLKVDVYFERIER